MSHKYKLDDEIPSSVLAERLDELSRAVSDGAAARDREFTMRVPAECDRDADLVLATAAARLRKYDELSEHFTAVIRARTPEDEAAAASALARAVGADLDACLAGEHADQARARHADVVARRGEG